MSQLLLQSLNVLNFKSWEQVSLQFSPSINCLLGSNGVGKTNLLDAIHYLCTTKSFLTNTDAHSIRHGTEFFMIKGLFERAGQQEEILLSLRKNDKKLLKRNDTEYQRLSDHIGLFPVIVISPMDVNLIYEGSEERRKVTDLILSLADTQYLHSLMRYNRLLQQRNSYLKDTAPQRKCSFEVLELYSEQMEPLADYIHSARSQFWEKTSIWLSQFYNSIAGSAEEVSVVYQSDLAQGSLTALHREASVRDAEALYTTRGIHKDDIEMRIFGYPLKRYGSQGQQKSYLIALKLAMYAVLQEKTGMPPILLFDDIFDKLDRSRTANVIRLVRDMNFGQIFLSDADPERSMQIASQFHGNARFFHIYADQKIHIE